MDQPHAETIVRRATLADLRRLQPYLRGSLLGLAGFLLFVWFTVTMVDRPTAISQHKHLFLPGAGMLVIWLALALVASAELRRTLQAHLARNMLDDKVRGRWSTAGVVLTDPETMPVGSVTENEASFMFWRPYLQLEASYLAACRGAGRDPWPPGQRFMLVGAPVLFGLGWTGAWLAMRAGGVLMTSGFIISPLAHGLILALALHWLLRVESWGILLRHVPTPR